MGSGLLWFGLIIFPLTFMAKTFFKLLLCRELIMIINGMEISDVFPRSYPFNQNWIKVTEMKQLKELVLATKNRFKMALI